MRYTSDMQRWEYLTFDLLERKFTIEELNGLGLEGWEAVATVGSWGVAKNFQHPVLLFKRPLPIAVGSEPAQTHASSTRERSP